MSTGVSSIRSFADIQASSPETQPATNVLSNTLPSQIPSVSSPIPPLPACQAWKIASREYSRRPKSTQSLLLPHLQSPETLLEAVKGFVEYQAKKIPGITKRLNPTVQYFLRFISPLIEPFINSATAAMPLSGALWGTFQIFVKLGFCMQQMVENIFDRLENIRQSLSRIASYPESLQGSARSRQVEQSLVDVYRNIISYCEECLEALRRRRSRIGFHSQLKSAENRVTESSERAEKEAFAASIEVMSSLRGVKLNVNPQMKQMMPVRNKNFFCGKSRDNIFDNMSAELLSQETGQKSFSLHGFGGVGKSALALEFAHRHQDAFPIILWFSADTPSNLAQSFSEAAQYLEEKGFDAPEDSKDKLRVFKRLRNCEEDWLLVYDNVEDIELVKSFWPTSSKGSVLIISQNPDTEFLPARRGCSVGPMPIEEGAEFLLSQLSAQTHSDTDRVSANKISEILGGWPLALATAAGVIGGGVWPLEDFERNLRESPTFHLEDELTSDPTSGRTKSIRMVSEMAVSGLSKGAKNVFDLCAFYDSDRILEGLITFDNIDEHVFPLPTNHEFYRAISELRKRSLVEKNERQLRVHRTLQAEAIKMMTPERRHLVFSTAVEIVASKYPKHSPGQLYMAHLWMDCELYLPHVISLEAKYKASSSSLNPPPPEFAELLYNCSWYLMEKNRIDLAFTLARTGHKLCEGPDGCKLILAGICTVLGALHLDKNETKDAYDYLDKARVLREEEVKNKRLAEYDPRLANSYSDLAASATALERYDEAVKLNHRSIKIRQKKPEIQIQMLSLTYHNLGTSLAKLSKVDDARAALEDSLEISKGRSDSSLREHAIANDMRTLYALGNLHLDQGQLSEALSRHEEALKLRLKTLGETHLMTGSSYHKLGSLHLKQGNFKKARELVEKALRAFNQMPGTLGEQARTTYLLSTICRELNDPEAETLKARAGELRKKLNGTKPDLQDTQADYNKLVIFFYR